MLDILSGNIFYKLTIFHSIIQHGSISGAASAVHRSPSAVSRQIQQLEEELGLTLLQRSAGGAVPTREGLALYSRTLEIFRNLEDLLNSAGTLRHTDKIAGVVKIISAPVAADCLLPLALPHIHQQYPDIYLDISVSSGKQIAMNALKAHDYHFAMADCEDLTAPVDFQPLFNTTICLISPRDYPLPDNLQQNPQLLEQLPVIGIQENRAIARFIQKHCNALGIHLHTTHVVHNIDMVINMVRAGMGVALADHNHLMALDHHKIDVLPMPVFPQRTIGLIQRHNSFQPPHVKEVIRILISCAQKYSDSQSADR